MSEPARDRFVRAGFVRSAVWTAAVLVVVTAVLLGVFRGPGARPAVLASAAVALAVQTLTFIAARAAAPRQRLAVWGAGAFVRLLTVVVYGLLAVRVLGYPLTPALLSLATLFFATTLAESRLHLR